MKATLYQLSYIGKLRQLTDIHSAWTVNLCVVVLDK